MATAGMRHGAAVPSGETSVQCVEARESKPSLNEADHGNPRTSSTIATLSGARPAGRPPADRDDAGCAPINDRSAKRQLIAITARRPKMNG